MFLTILGNEIAAANHSHNDLGRWYFNFDLTPVTTNAVDTTGLYARGASIST